MTANSAAQNAGNVKKIMTLGGILFTVTAITGIILGVVYQITLEPIRLTQERLRTEALSGALPEAETFSDVELVSGANPIIRGVARGEAGEATAGYCVTVAPRGYAGPVEIIVGITESGTLRAIRILSQSETPGLGAKSAAPEFFGQYENIDALSLSVVKSAPSAPEQIQAISGATITSNAVTLGVNTALDYWRKNIAEGYASADETDSISGASEIGGE